MALSKIVIGSRGSELALWQANWVKAELERLYPQVQSEIKIIKTEGDKIQDVALSKIGDKGLFTKAIEDALLDESIDLAVHSLKDLPTTLPAGLGIAAVSAREDQHDLLISKNYQTIDELPQNATIATGSLRRRSQLLSYRNDLNVVDIRGNITTRIKKFEESDWAGIILAYAGVKRLELNKYAKQVIPEDIILPAVGQGVMAIETRINDNELNGLLKAINNDDSMAQILTERSLLRTVEGGCQVPVGVYTNIWDGKISLKAMIGSLDGKQVVKSMMEDKIENAESLGKKVGNDLLSRGGREILQNLRSS